MVRLFPPASPAAKNKSIIGLLLKLYTINQDGLYGTIKLDGQDGQSYRLPAVSEAIHTLTTMHGHGSQQFLI